MNLQHERISKACECLGLHSTLMHYQHLAQQAADEQHSYTTFLENVLLQE